MSGLQLAQKKDEPAAAAPATAPPPVPAPAQPAGEPESQAQPTHTPPPPPPPPSRVGPAPLHQEDLEESSSGRGRTVGIAAGVLLLVGGLGAGGWYLYQHPHLIPGLGRTAPVSADAGAQLGPVEWPVIQLTGLAGVTGSGDTGSAILNGNLISLNQRIEGATLVDISGDGVILELQHESKFLRIGDTTE